MLVYIILLWYSNYLFSNYRTTIHTKSIPSTPVHQHTLTATNPLFTGISQYNPIHHTIHKKHIKPSSYIAKFPYQLRVYKKYFFFSDHFNRNTLLFLLVYIMFFRTHIKISLFRYKYSLFSYLFHIVHIQKTL